MNNYLGKKDKLKMVVELVKFFERHPKMCKMKKASYRTICMSRCYENNTTTTKQIFR